MNALHLRLRDELSFPGSEQNKKPADEATQTLSFVTEKQGEEQAQKTKKKGTPLSRTKSRESTTLTETSRPSGSAMTDSFQDEFPLIEVLSSQKHHLHLIFLGEELVLDPRSLLEYPAQLAESEAIPPRTQTLQ